MPTDVVQRTVAIHTNARGKDQVWVIDPEHIVERDGSQFVYVGYTDRDFARYVGGEMSASNPLKKFTWLEEAQKLRKDACDVELEKVAIQKDLTHVPGTPVKHKKILSE